MTTTTDTPRRRPGRPKDGDSEATREGIVRAARRCFARDGYALATNKAIASRAGVTAGAIYNYFESKLGLYLAVVRETHQDLNARYKRDAEKAGGGIAGLISLLDTAAALLDEDPDAVRFLSAVAVEVGRDPEIAMAMRAEQSAVLELVGQLCSEAVERGELPSDTDPQVFAALFVACHLGLSLYGSSVSPELARPMLEGFAKLLRR